MIGFFDSGFGGLTVMKEVVKKLPKYSYVYLGDNARTPYGSLSKSIIYKYTTEGVAELFRRGAQIVVLACNTASAMALRKIQQDWLPKNYPDKKVLGIIIPSAQGMKKRSKKSIGIFATEVTVRSRTFANEIAKLLPERRVFQQACPLIVPAIESGKMEKLDAMIERYVQKLLIKNKNIGEIILGCTHYAIIEKIFRKNIPEKIEIALQGKIVAEKLKEYLLRHDEIEKKLEKKRKKIFLTTKDSAKVEKLARMFYGKKIKVKVVTL